MKQECFIGCMPCVDSMKAGFVPYKNSTVAKCSECDCEVWLGPKQKEFHEQQGYPIVCLICLYKKYGDEVLGNIIPLTDKKTGD